MTDAAKRDTALVTVQNDLDVLIAAELSLQESECVRMADFIGAVPGSVWKMTPETSDATREDALRDARKIKGELEVRLEQTQKRYEPYSTADAILMKLNKIKDHQLTSADRGSRRENAPPLGRLRLARA